MLECCEGANMYAAQNVVLRVSIVLGMVAAVVTILYFTPTPDQFFKSCDRPCHDLDWPMICRFKLVYEPYQTMSSSCEGCPNNLTHCNGKYCASADGISRSIFAANRQLPGPSIQICKNDILVVDVINKVPGHSITVHWRGQTQRETPFMDGVPMITQCPIPSYTTFQYKFRASSAGTHFWHAHSHVDSADGFFGALVVRQPEKQEPHRKLYDVDDKTHVLLVSEWGSDQTTTISQSSRKPFSILVNGKAATVRDNILSIFKVKKGLRYRFRVAYTGGIPGCPITVNVEHHILKVIALDGNPTVPYEASSFTLAKGERLDFILKTSEKKNSYIFKMVSKCNEKVADGMALIKYEGGIDKDKEEKSDETKSQRTLNTGVCQSQLGKVCLNNLSSLKKIPVELRKSDVERKIYFPFDFKLTKDLDETYSTDQRKKIHRVNNLTFDYPSSPLLTQLVDVNYKSLCNSLTIPKNCEAKEICECVHIEHIPLDATVELVIIDKGGDSEEHVFHLHGYRFYVVGSRQFEAPPTLEEVKGLDERGALFKRNIINPVRKDTIRVPKNGAVAIRFVANNPGFWILRDELSREWTRGLDVIFQVGNPRDMVSTPTDFPTCRNWVGPDFFLL